jgi:hypothetical protein
MPITTPRNFATDVYGFAPPNSGGDVGVMWGSLVFGDTTKTLFALPARAVVTDIMIIVSVAFTAGTTNTLNLGYTGTLQAYAATAALGNQNRGACACASAPTCLPSQGDRFSTLEIDVFQT